MKRFVLISLLGVYFSSFLIAQETVKFGDKILNKYQLFVGNDWGLLPIYKNDSDAEIDLGSGVKNVNLTISLSYLF